MSIFLYSMIALTALVRLFFFYKSIQNERKLKQLGAVEYTRELSNLIIVFHVIFYLFAYYEALNEYYTFDLWVGIGIVIYTFSIVVLLLITRELGVYWTVRLFKAQNQPISQHWLYKKFRHPNYFLNIIPELIGLSLIFKAGKTFAILFPIYMILLGIRIFFEENLFKKEYKESYGKKEK